jgi:sugar phosphate isomerase/epimerase
MKLAYSANAYMKHGPAEAVDRIADLGYRGIELMADLPHLWPATTTIEQLDAVRRRLDQRAMSIANVNAFMMNAVGDFWHPSWIEDDEDYRSLRIDHTIAALRMAARLGAPSITTEPGGPLGEGHSREQAMELFAAGLRRALHVAEEVGVLLLVEPEPGLLVETATDFLDLAERVQSPMFGLNFDAGHFYCVSDPLPETVTRLQGFTRHYHLEDIAATRVHQHLIPGHGAIDFAGLLRAVQRTGYDGWLTVELYPYLEDPDAAGREAMAFLAAMLTS